MHNPFKRQPKPYLAERDRLLEKLASLDPAMVEYDTVMNRLNELDRIINRASETKKAVIPAVGTAVAIGGVYALQQFGGVIVPKALEQIAARQEQKKSNNKDD
jgi:hypothetical protein